jgi:hypothetical protein
MSGPLLYSTNTLMNFIIQQRFRSDIHWVWCSEVFDSRKSGSYSDASLVAPSSNPADIYRELQRDVAGKDSHSAKITAQKASLTALAVQWEANGDITTEHQQEIIYMVTTAAIEYWRPLLYVIPRMLVQKRLQLVPIEKRAGFGTEYIIADLRRDEFELLEF